MEIIFLAVHVQAVKNCNYTELKNYRLPIQASQIGA